MNLRGRSRPLALAGALDLVGEDLHYRLGASDLVIGRVTVDATQVCTGAFANVCQLAIGRKTGARGLRTILESVLLDTMYELPSSTSAKKVVLDEAVVIGETKPYIIHESEEPATDEVDQHRRQTG